MAQGLGKGMTEAEQLQEPDLVPTLPSAEQPGQGHSLALLIQQIEEACGLLADEVDAAHIVGVVNVVP